MAGEIMCNMLSKISGKNKYWGMLGAIPNYDRLQQLRRRCIAREEKCAECYSAKIHEKENKFKYWEM